MGEGFHNLYLIRIPLMPGFKKQLNGHSPSYFLVEKTTKRPFVILKQSDQIVFSSFKRDLIPDFPIEALGWENEIIGYEQDQLFGLDHTPITFGVQFLSEENSVTGIIQEYVPNSISGADLYTPQGAELLKSIPSRSRPCYNI